MCFPEAPGNMLIPHDDDDDDDAPHTGPRFDMYRRLAACARAHGSLFVCQLSHAGRQVPADLQPDPLGASAVPLTRNVLGKTFARPHAASTAELRDVVAAFAHAARYVEAAGFDGVQLHGAHGYLLAQFLSPTTNRREDAYGADGRVENRGRLLCEVARAVRNATGPAFVLGVKLNSVEFQQRGLHPADAARFCRLLERERVDFVELSGGTYEEFGFHHRSERTRAREAFFLEFAELIAPCCGNMKVYLTGGLRTAQGMRNVLAVADGVGLGRPTTQEPLLPRGILDGAVPGAHEQVFNQDDFAVTTAVSSSQMRQIAELKPPFDGRNESNVPKFLEQLDDWVRKKGEDTENGLYLPMDVHGLFDLPVER